MLAKCPKCGHNIEITGLALVGYEEIGKFMRVTGNTARRYRTLFGMPIFRLPNNKPITTPALIFEWLRQAEKITRKPKPRPKIAFRDITELPPC